LELSADVPVAGRREQQEERARWTTFELPIRDSWLLIENFDLSSESGARRSASQFVQLLRRPTPGRPLGLEPPSLGLKTLEPPAGVAAERGR